MKQINKICKRNKSINFKVMKGVMVVLSLVTLSACGQKETPLGSLSSQTLSQKYDKSFWKKEQVNNTPLWKQAKQACTFYTPNCGVIGVLQSESFAN